MTPEDLDDVLFVNEMTTTGRAREVRTRAGLSNAWVGAYCGADKSTAARWEQRKTAAPRLAHLRKYAELLRQLDQRAA